MYRKKNMFMSIAMIITCLVYLLLKFIADYQYTTYFWTVFCSIAAFVVCAIMTVNIIIGIVWWIKYAAEKNPHYILNTIFNVISGVLVATCICFHILQMTYSTTNGLEKNIKTYKTDVGYFIVVNHKNIQVLKDQYEYIDVTKDYYYQYDYNIILDKYTLTKLNEK